MSTHLANRQRLSGILNCFKPAGITSRVIVDAVQREVRPAKVGHAGTLDPLAEGVLVVAIGSASKLIPYLHLFSKTYKARFELGCWSDSADLETDIIQVNDPIVPSRQQVIDAARSFVGRIQQIPPIYSAVKVGGQRAYEAARKNQLLELSARTVDIHRFEVIGYEYPSVWVEIECGTGTYIRSLAVDLAKSLATKGLMSQLVRTSVGPFHLQDAVRIDEGLPDNFTELLHPLSTATSMLPRVTLSAGDLIEVEHGRTIQSAESAAAFQFDQEIAAYDQAGRLKAILLPRAGGLGPKRVFK